jgi:branched-chain amino acid transport system substrate-binding protein
VLTKRSPLAVLLVAIVVVAGFLTFQYCSRAADQITLGAVLPMTGDAATFGQNAFRGVKVAVDQENQAGGIDGNIVVLKVEDSRGSAQNAVSALRKLIDLDKVKMVVGDVTSAGTHALIPIVTQAKIPLISPAASDPALSNASPYFARDWPSDVYEAEIIGGYARKKDFNSLAVLYANTDYGVAMLAQFEKVVTPAVIKLKIPVDRETLDYRPSIQRILSAQVAAVFVVLYPEDAKRFLQQGAEQQLGSPLLATATIEDPSVAKAPGAERIVFASPVPPAETASQRKTFADAYMKAFNAAPGVVSDTAYDATRILIKAARTKGVGDGLGMMNFVRSLANYEGASGVLSFSKSGDVQKPYKLRTVKGGTFTWLEE